MCNYNAHVSQCNFNNSGQEIAGPSSSCNDNAEVDDSVSGTSAVLEDDNLSDIDSRTLSSIDNLTCSTPITHDHEPIVDHSDVLYRRKLPLNPLSDNLSLLSFILSHHNLSTSTPVSSEHSFLNDSIDID